MKRVIRASLVAGLTVAAMGVATAADVLVMSDAGLPPPRRYLTTYMAQYPFGTLREDYTPLGAPGVSKAAYFGRPMLTATLHTRSRHTRRAVISMRY